MLLPSKAGGSGDGYAEAGGKTPPPRWPAQPVPAPDRTVARPGLLHGGEGIKRQPVVLGVWLAGPGRAASGPPGGQAAGAAQEGARTTGRPRAGKMFPGGHQDSAGEAGTTKARVPGKISDRPGERSERPVAGTDEAAQADPAGSHAARATDPKCTAADWRAAERG